MPVDADVLRNRISEINFTISELQRLTSKPFVQLLMKNILYGTT